MKPTISWNDGQTWYQHGCRSEPPADAFECADLEVLFADNTVARGNLYHAIDWMLVVAYRVNGRMRRTGMSKRYRLVWEESEAITPHAETEAKA